MFTELVKLFPNGTSFMIYEERNCCLCLKYFESDEPGYDICLLRAAMLDAACLDGKVTLDVYQGLGMDEPNTDCSNAVCKEIWLEAPPDILQGVTQSQSKRLIECGQQVLF